MKPALTPSKSIATQGYLQGNHKKNTLCNQRDYHPSHFLVLPKLIL
jgi:hypothetical protein